MLYRLGKSLDTLEPLPFVNFTEFKKLEHDLEELIAENLLNALFEGTPLLPFHQERPYHAESDIYSLNEDGDIVLFELKRAVAEDGALDQLFRYTQKAGRWSYSQLDRMFREHSVEEFDHMDLRAAHQQAFSLPAPLRDDQFNRSQHMVVIGSAADDGLIRAVDFWKRKALSIEFIPYRIYEIGDGKYFEFFSKPHDAHSNPAEVKGVIFDTNQSFRPEATRRMIEKKRIAAYGERKTAVKSLKKNDIVFYSQAAVGLVAAAQVIGKAIKADGDDELYWDVKFLTPVPTQFDHFPKAMSFGQVQQVTGKKFFWARIQKVPYLSRDEAGHLLEELNKVLA